MARGMRPARYARGFFASLALCIALAPGYSQGGPASGSGDKIPAASPEKTEKPPKAEGSTGSGGATGAGVFGNNAQSERLQAAERKRFGDWLAASPEGLRLAEYWADIEALAYASLAAGVPVDAYKLRIKEAAAKGVAPAIVMAALREDARHWDKVGAALWDKGWPPMEKAPDLFIASATALRNGLAFSAALELFEWAAPARAQSERVAAVLKALTLIVASLPLNAGEAGQAALELAKSRLPVGQFDELAGLAAAAAMRSVPPGDFARALIEALRQAKPLEALARRFSL